MNFERAAKTSLTYAGKTMIDLAQHWGVTRQTVANRLANNDPKHSYIVSICEFCGVSKEDFMKWGEQ